MVAERGIRALRVADVAERAGLSNGSVHYYFDSKQQLLREAFEFNFKNSLSRRAWIMREAIGPIHRLQLLIESYLPAAPETVQAWRVWVELWVSALGESESQALNDMVYGEWRAVVLQTITEAQALGFLRTRDPVEVADALVGMLDGLAIQVLIGSTHMTLERMRSTCLAFLQAELLDEPREGSPSPRDTV